MSTVHGKKHIRKKHSQHKWHGFTLLELLTTLLLVSILMATAIPSFKSSIAKNRLTKTQQSLSDTLNLARSEAIKRGQRVIVCASTDQENCSEDPTAWNTGWLIMATANADGEAIAPDDPEALLVTVTTDELVQVITASDRVAFRADGSAQQTLQLVLCDENGKASLDNNSLFVNFAGRHIKENVNPTGICPA